MIDDKTDAGPERGDGEAQGVSPPDPDPRRHSWRLAEYGRDGKIPPGDAPIEVWRPGWMAPLATTWGALRPPPEYYRVYWWRWAKTKEVAHMADEPKPPGDGWRRMWGEGSLKPAPSVDVEVWHHSWQGVRCLDEFPEGSSIKGIWWRPMKPNQGSDQDKPRPLPSWAKAPMIDSGPSNPPSATLSRNPNIPEGAHVVVGSSIGWNTAAQPKHRIVQAWHDYAEHLTVLGSDGRIHFRDHEGQWIEIATYPPGLEP